MTRGAYGPAGGRRQPVKRGPLLLAVRAMKCVRSTIRVVRVRPIGSSNGPATGALPASRRIQAAWRAVQRF